MEIAIYLDTNILRYLQKESKYEEFYKKILETKGEYSYYYSYAHLLDLKRDVTEHKFEDLKFMETIVDQRYLIHPYGKSYIEVHNESPTDAFNNIAEETDSPTLTIDYLLTQFEDEEDDDETIKVFNNIMRTLLEEFKNIPAFDLSTLNLEALAPEHKKMIEKLIPLEKEKITYGDIMNKTSVFHKELYDYKDSYKELRRYLVSNLNLTKDIDYTNENFNDDFQKTYFQKTFYEYIYGSLDPDHNKEITWEAFIIQAYTQLNILGVDKEPNKKARFPNTFNDAQHSYYASSCHYIVSDDEAFLIKCRLLYKLIDFKAVVLTFDEFIEKFESLATDAELIFKPDNIADQ